MARAILVIDDERNMIQRDRIEDVTMLLRRFVSDATWDRQVLSHFNAYDWPGNIAKLQRIARQAALSFCRQASGDPSSAQSTSSISTNTTFYLRTQIEPIRTMRPDILFRMPLTPLIVIVEDDAQIRRVVEGYLQQDGYRVLTAPDGPTGLAMIQQERPSLVILDIMLPGMDGLEIARRLRSNDNPAIAGVYIIMLTARVEEADRIVGLELGADDYVTKPFSPRELAARVRAALRRLTAETSPGAKTRQEAGGLTLDPTYRTAVLDGSAVDLTATEFDLLDYMMRHPGRPFTRSQLLDITQPDALGDTAAYERTIDAHIKNIRQKLGDSGRRNRFIETVHGVGYRFAGQETKL